MDPRDTMLRDLFARLNARRYDSIGELLSDDAVFDVPYAPPSEGVTLPAVGRAAFVRMFTEATAQLFSKIEMSIADIYLGADADVAIVEYASQGIVSFTGRPYSNRYCGVFRFRDGRITLWREYFNPKELEKSAAP
jgi:hypothetical protein